MPLAAGEKEESGYLTDYTQRLIYEHAARGQELAEVKDTLLGLAFKLAAGDADGRYPQDMFRHLDRRYRHPDIFRLVSE